MAIGRILFFSIDISPRSYDLFAIRSQGGTSLPQKNLMSHPLNGKRIGGRRQ
ncbi:hypothetical protein HMPREF1548_00902 [Clostridium sp. KLE 1755]|nr:hypothetical protein HMPREF1548_00902 [Clostridium sp. KLE 1755]